MDSYKPSDKESASCRETPDDLPLYSIRDLADEFGITPRAIRFYESKRLISPKKIDGQRYFTEMERTRLFLVVQSRKLGMPVVDIRAILDIYYRGDDRRVFYKMAVEKLSRHIESLKARQKQIGLQMQELQKICGKLEKQISTNRVSLPKALGYLPPKSSRIAVH